MFGSDSDFRLSQDAGEDASVAESASARIIFSLQTVVAAGL
jgi:hypothetical protein